MNKESHSDSELKKIYQLYWWSFSVIFLVAESQHIVNVNWDKLQTISNSVLSTIAVTATANSTSTTGGTGLSIPSILGNNTGAAAASILPITGLCKK